MAFLSNISGTHAKEINRLIKDADEICIAVAFLKQSGLNALLSSIKQAVKSKANISIIAGRNYALTDPEALKELFQLFKLSDNTSLRLAKYGIKDQIFHPKLYLFRKGDTATIISGSANLTKGGLESNIECSLMLQCNTNDRVWQDAYAFFVALTSDERSDEANLLSIQQYETFYHEQKQRRKKIKAIPSQTRKQTEFNYKNLQRYHAQYVLAGGKNWLQDKIIHYREARKVLDTIVNDTKLTKSWFITLYDELVGASGEPGWWHSNGLYRNKTDVYEYYKEFQKMARFISDHRTDAPEFVFNTAMHQVQKIYGASVAIVGEIMMTYNNKKFANLNSNPVSVLREVGGVHLKATPSLYNENEYKEYCELIYEIENNLGLSNMLEVDSFFNYIYQKLKQKNK